jgi:putative FmdB family regulatory protein
MPIYDYECRSCGHRVEVIHGVNSNGPTACERCGGPMRKLLTTPSIVFKGSGWAKKDARDARPAARSESATADKSDGGSSDKPSVDAATGGGKDAPGKSEVAKTKSTGSSEATSQGKSEKPRTAD